MVMLTSAFRTLVNNPVKESFYEKKKNNKYFESFFHFP